jgi:hypothetical protein
MSKPDHRRVLAAQQSVQKAHCAPLPGRGKSPGLLRSYFNASSKALVHQRKTGCRSVALVALVTPTKCAVETTRNSDSIGRPGVCGMSRFEHGRGHNAGAFPIIPTAPEPMTETPPNLPVRSTAHWLLRMLAWVAGLGVGGGLGRGRGPAARGAGAGRGLPQPARHRQPDRLPAQAAAAGAFVRRRAAGRVRRGAAHLHADRPDPGR